MGYLPGGWDFQWILARSSSHRRRCGARAGKSPSIHARCSCSQQGQCQGLPDGKDQARSGLGIPSTSVQCSLGLLEACQPALAMLLPVGQHWKIPCRSWFAHERDDLPDSMMLRCTAKLQVQALPKCLGCSDPVESPTEQTSAEWGFFRR